MKNPFEHNAHGGAPDDAIEYEELTNVITLEGITFTRDRYLEDEYGHNLSRPAHAAGSRFDTRV